MEFKSFMNRALIVGLITLLFVCVGCSSSPTIDSSTEKTFKASLQEMAKSLPEGKRAEFQKTITGMGMLLAFAKKGDQDEMRKFFDGMTYDDIMAKAQELRERAKKEQ